MDISQLTSLGRGLTGPSGFIQTYLPPATSGSAADRTQAQAAETVQAAQPDPASIRQAVDQINEVVRALTSNLEFAMDEETGTRMIKVVDNDSGEVIRQIPSEEILAIVKSLNQFQGLMVRESA